MRSLHLLPLAFVAAASANTTLTFNGTITAGSPDRAGEAVTITFVLSDDPLAMPGVLGAFYDENLDHVDLFSSISGTGITGAWLRPVIGSQDPFSEVALSPTKLTVYAFNESIYPIGLNLYGFAVYGVWLEGVFAANQPAPNPGTYDELFDGFPPSPALSAESNGRIVTSGGDYNFDLTSLTISSGAIPEPSTYGLILGGLALAGAAIRRRKSAK